REAALESWSLKIQRHLPDVRSICAFAGNHFEGFAPETCQRLAQRLGFVLPLPPETKQAFSIEKGSQLDLQLKRERGPLVPLEDADLANAQIGDFLRQAG